MQSCSREPGVVPPPSHTASMIISPIVNLLSRWIVVVVLDTFDLVGCVFVFVCLYIWYVCVSAQMFFSYPQLAVSHAHVCPPTCCCWARGRWATARL